jgi:hypothetical protein
MSLDRGSNLLEGKGRHATTVQTGILYDRYLLEPLTSFSMLPRVSVIKDLIVSAYRLYNLDYNLNYIIQIII